MKNLCLIISGKLRGAHIIAERLYFPIGMVLFLHTRRKQSVYCLQLFWLSCQVVGTFCEYFTNGYDNFYYFLYAAFILDVNG